MARSSVTLTLVSSFKERSVKITKENAPKPVKGGSGSRSSRYATCTFYGNPHFGTAEATGRKGGHGLEILKLVYAAGEDGISYAALKAACDKREDIRWGIDHLVWSHQRNEIVVVRDGKIVDYKTLKGAK